MPVVSKFNRARNFAASKCLSQKKRTNPFFFARDMMIEPPAYDSIISSIVWESNKRDQPIKGLKKERKNNL